MRVLPHVTILSADLGVAQWLAPEHISRQIMFSHIVIFWTHPENPNAANELLAGVDKYLRNIPGVVSFHAGRMVRSHRPVVDQTYQVALNIVFTDKAAQDAYQDHPSHVEFVENVFKKVCKGVIVYDFE